MSLEEDLRQRTLALISSQMATWIVDIQRHIRGNQEQLVRMLDELGEQVARYDEKIDESAIAQAMAEVVAQQPPPTPRGPGFDRLKASLAQVEKGASLSEVLTYLVNEVSQYMDRTGMFIVKGPSAIGWYGKGFEPADAVKQLNIPLTAQTVFQVVNSSRQAMRTTLAQTPGTAQVMARLGGQPQGVLAVPLILRDKLAAILYCDTRQPQVPAAEADLIEVLVSFAGKIIDIISVAPKPAVGKTSSGGTTADRAAQIRQGGDEVRERAGVPPAAAPRPAPAPAAHDESGTVMMRAAQVPARPPAPAPAPAHDEGSSTVMFNAAQLQGMRTAVAAPPPPKPAPPPAPAGPALSPEEQKAHDDAKRFARLVVSEIKLYNEAKVNEGRRHKDLYERLKEDIERGRQMYMERVSAHVRESTNYFYDELVRILAGGDAAALGPM